MKNTYTVILISLLAVAFTSCKNDKKEDPGNIPAAEERRPLVTVFEAKDTLFNHYLELQGSVDTKENIIINAEFGGNLTNVFVQQGQKVNRGDELAKIDDGGLARQLSQARAQSSLAYTTYKRQKRLWEQKIGSEMEYLKAQTDWQSASNTVKQLEAQLGRAKIKAPFTGTIDEIFSEQGTVVSPGIPVMRIVNLDSMYIEAEVSEKYIKGIKDSVPVNVSFPILNREINTVVKQVSDFINPANRSFKITVDIPPEEAQGIKPNLTARLKINDYTNPNAILIPQDIISEDAQERQYVYVVSLYNEAGEEEHVAKKVFIKTGETQEDLIEVLDGIKRGDIVIKEGARNVKDGQKVKIII